MDLLAAYASDSGSGSEDDERAGTSFPTFGHATQQRAAAPHNDAAGDPAADHAAAAAAAPEAAAPALLQPQPPLRVRTFPHVEGLWATVVYITGGHVLWRCLVWQVHGFVSLCPHHLLTRCCCARVACVALANVRSAPLGTRAAA
jgi:hypothetical protein